MLLAALRRLAVLLLVVAGATATVSLVVGLLAGAGVSRSVSLGLYLVGSFILIVGFFVGNRGPLRVKDDAGSASGGSARLRRATLSEREESINSSAVFVTLGFLVIVLGMLADTRYSLV